jgi:hypothetical protein
MTRWTVDFSHGYVSFDDEEKEKAFELYREDSSAIRIRKCRDIFDEGEVVEGMFVVEDISSVASGSFYAN